MTGRLSESGDQMDVTFFVTFFDAAGSKIGEGGSVNFKGVRVPLDILPHSADTLPVPVISPSPQRLSSDLPDHGECPRPVV